MTHEYFNRKLTALLSADVVGYSRMMESNETATLESLTANKSIMADLIRDCCGRIVDSPGDNLLAEFSSAIAAVECATRIQIAIKERNGALPQDHQMTYRIGVNLGDVIEEQGRLYGDCVNITARLQTLAAPGSICISGFVFDHVAGKLPLACEYLGKQTVKNIDKPVRVYRLVDGSAPSGKGRPKKIRPFLPKTMRRSAFLFAILLLVSAGAYFTKPWNTINPAPAGTELPVIAVLPFENLSQSAEFDNFTDALTDDIITNLSQLSGLAVIARNSVFTYKNKPTKTQVLAMELNAQYVLEGSLRRADDQILINVQLIDALPGSHIWAQRYDLKVKDLMAVQIDITAKVAAALNLPLSNQDSAMLREKGTGYLNAYMKKLEAGEQNLQPKEKDLKTEMIFWQSVENSRQLPMYEEYLRKFPEGIFSGLARLNILKLTASGKKSSAAAESAQARNKSQAPEEAKEDGAEKPPASKPQTQSTGEAASEEILWRSIQGSTKAEDFDNFLNKYPHGIYAELASIKRRNLSQSPEPPKHTENDGKTYMAVFREKAETLYYNRTRGVMPLDRKNSITEGLKTALDKYPALIPKWSAYDLGKKYRLQPPEDRISPSIPLDSIWTKDTATGKEMPNIQVVRKIGDMLEVDTVLMFRTYDYSMFFTRSYYYLVDIKTGRITTQIFDAGDNGPYDFSPVEIRDNILELINRHLPETS